VKLNLDLKTLITIITFAVSVAGFYYSTQSRLDELENKISVLEKKVKRLNKQNSHGINKNGKK
jgi:cell division protein FtsL